MAEIVYLNGVLVPKEKACISVGDYGFLSGAGLFETMRAYNGRIFRLDKHIDRLLSSASLLGLARKLRKVELIAACNETLKANGLKEARIRLTVSMGEAGAFPGKIVSPTTLITASRYTPPPENKYKNGFRACIAAFRQYSGAALAGVKSTGYLPNLLARRQAQEHCCDEALFLNENGRITEGTTSNIFFIDAAGKLVTPPLGSGPLPGVTRRVILELAAAMGIDFSESVVKPEDISGFREAFLTNSVAEVMPLVSVSEGEKEFTIGSGKPGQITGKLNAAYKELVRKETAA
jgi:branched-subunit amino acid aminotransferase/4-amino-4-deoxychorismate lyase